VTPTRCHTGPVAGTVHRYQARCAWRGSTADGYLAYDRAHDAVSAPADQRLRLSADPAFRGDPALLNPEQLVVLAAASCQLLSFLASAALSGVDVRAYEDEADAEMPEGDEPMRITRIVLRPRIEVAEGSSEALVRRLVAKAHDNCYVANTLRCAMEVEATITFVPA
jgi:organic hydroperoxide reductase OsmC/OhrA